MELTTAPLKSVQIRDFLRDQILSGKLPQGAKVATMRNLADKFSVSRQAVESAFQLLEDERLIARRGRAGAYVSKPAYAKDVKGVFLLAYDVNPQADYLHRILKMTAPPYLKDDFTFLTRVIPERIANMTALDAELRRVSQMPEIDCIAACSSIKDKAVLKRLTEQRLPVIFIGDFAIETPGFKCNQITADNGAHAADCVSHMLSRGYRDIVLFTGPLTARFNATFKDAAQRTVKAAGARLHTVERRYDAGVEDYLSAIAGLVKTGVKFDAILNNGCRAQLIFEAIKSSGFDIPAQVGLLSSMSFDETQADTAEPDFSPLFEAVYDRISELKADPSSPPVKTTLHLPVSFIARGRACQDK